MLGRNLRDNPVQCIHPTEKEAEAHKDNSIGSGSQRSFEGC